MNFLRKMAGHRERQSGHAARRSPGAWQRRRLLKIYLGLLLPNAVLLGVLAGALMSHWWSIELAVWIQAAAFVVLLAAFWWVLNRMRYSAKNLEKGLEAEWRTGEVIDYALTHMNCAAAHNVEGIGSGDIDHLVVTPHALWVIDSKYRFDDRWLQGWLTLTAKRVRAVERWSGQQAPVRGCLAFLSGFDRDPEEHRAEDGTPVLCVDVNNGFVKSLHDDMRRDGRTVDKALFKRVWEMGAETGLADS